MSTAHRKYSKTFSMVASSMGALFIRVMFIVVFVYAWFLIAQTPSSENSAVLFGDDKLPSEKRLHENHLEVEKLIPVDNTANLLHSIGSHPVPPPPTYAPFHEDKFFHDPPFEGPAETRHNPLTRLDDTLLSSTVNEKQQNDNIEKYESNTKPNLKQSFSENDDINLQTPIKNKPSSNNIGLVNTADLNTTASDQEQYSSTTVSGRTNEAESSASSTTPVSVFSNFRDKLLNIIMPKTDEDQQNEGNVTSDKNTVGFDTDGNQEEYATSRENASYDRLTDDNTMPAVATTRLLKENDKQSNSQDRFRFQTQIVSDGNEGYIYPERKGGIKTLDRVDNFNKIYGGSDPNENIRPTIEDSISPRGNNIKDSVKLNNEDNISTQSSQNPVLQQQNIPAQPHIRKEYHKQPLLSKTEMSEDITHRLSSRNGLCPTGDVITVVAGGRLANCIWEYASLWSVNKYLPGNRTAYAQKNIMKYLNKIFENLNMPVVEEIAEDCACCKNANWTASNIHMYSLIPLKEVQRKFENVPGNIILSKYIVLVEPVVATIRNLKKEMAYKHSLVQSAMNVIKIQTEEFLLKNDIQGAKITYVGVHVRRTDYINYLMSKYNMTALGPQYYLKAMKYFREHRPDLGRPIFLVVSDDIPWVEKNLIENDVFVVGEGDVEHPEHDLVLLSLCNHSIIDYGTYGLWAAVYAGGVTVTVKTSLHVHQILGKNPNWHFVTVNPAEEIEIY